MQPQPFETLDIALDCLKAHPTWFLFPISRLEKFPPCFENNLVLASNDPKQIRKWYLAYPGCNWGVSLKKSKLVVPDVDTKPGKDGQATLDKLELEHGPMPDTLTVRTPSGGLHYYYEEANGIKHQMRVNAFGKDIDSTNYTLVPGCWLVDSAIQNYEIVNDKPVAPTPAWFGEYLADRVAVVADQTPAVDLDTQAVIERAKEYLRDDAKPSIQFKNGEFTLLMTAAALKDMGISQETAIELLVDYYNPRCEPAWSVYDGPPADRLDLKVANAWNYLKNTQPGALSPQAEFGAEALSRDDYVDIANDIEREKDEYAARAIWKRDLDAKREAEAAAKREEAKAQTDTAKAEREEMGEDIAPEPPEPPTKPKKTKEPPQESETAKAQREEIVAAITEEPEREPWDVVDDASDEIVEAEREELSEIVETKEAPRGATSYKMPLPKLPNIPLGTVEENKKEMIDETIPPGTIKDVCRQWVWIIQMKRYVNRFDPSKQWDEKQFDSVFNRFAKKGTISKELSGYNLLRKFDTLAYRPGMPETDGEEYNIWRPSPVVPVEGNTDLWNQHINFLFQDDNDRNLVLNWMAFVVQNPTKKPNHALLIVGRNTGTGKSLVARVFEKIIGVRNTQRPKNSSMGGDFNAWLMNCRLCILEEVYQVGRRENMLAMRDLITEERVEVNKKGISAFPIDNCVAMMGISNHPDALPLDECDRRWLVIETFATRRGEEYYRPLLAMLDDPKALGAIYAELLARDLQGYSGMYAAPETQARSRMIELSRNDEETWMMEHAGNMPFRRNVIRAEDVLEAMPPSMQRVKRVLTTAIPNFLRDRMQGIRHPQQVRLTNGDKIRVWVLHGRYNMVKDADLAAIYEKERKMTDRDAETAKSDFAEEA